MAITFYNNWKLFKKLDEENQDALPEFRIIELVIRQLESGHNCLTASLLGFGIVILF